MRLPAPLRFCMKVGDCMNTNVFLLPKKYIMKFNADEVIRNFRGFVDVGPIMSNLNCLIDSMGKIAYKEGCIKTALIMEVKDTHPELELDYIRTLSEEEMIELSGALLINLGRVSLPSRGVNLLQRHTLEQLKSGGLIEDELLNIVYINQY